MRFDQATAVVTGIGGCLPDRVLSNQDVIAAGALGTSDDWIRTRTGIARRRHVDPCTSTGDLAVAAGRAALESARASGDAAEYRDPDLLVLATSTPDHPCPATAPDVAHRMGLGTVPAFDLAAVCSGFLYALTTATALLRGGACRAPLVIAADTYSTILDPQDRGTAPIFGDGAAAVLLRLGPPDHPGAVLAADLGADGSGHQLITIPAGGSARRALEQARWTPTAVDAFIGHQANQRILDSVAERLGLPATRCFGNIHELGNTARGWVGAAAAPLSDGGSQAAEGVLQGGRDGEEEAVAVVRGDELDGAGETLRAEARRHADGGVAGVVEQGGVGDGDGAFAYGGDHVRALGGPGGGGGGRGQQ